MKYVLFGDIHSSKYDLEAVLAHIDEEAPEAIRIGTGDLFECTVSKKDLNGQVYERMEDVMIIPEGFMDLLNFISIRGNQEERILLLTETNDPIREKIAAMPETFEIGESVIIHGHQWTWGGEPWSLQHADRTAPLAFYGHSHRSELRRDGKQIDVQFDVPYSVQGDDILVNVGAVTVDREWLLYDSENNTVTFMKA